MVGMDVNPERAGAGGGDGCEPRACWGSWHSAPTRLRRTPSKPGPDVGSRERLPKQLLTIFTSHSEKTDISKAFRALHGRVQVGSQNPHQPVDWPGFSELPLPV